MIVVRRQVTRTLIAIGVGVSLLRPDVGRAQTGKWLPAFIQTQKWIQLAKAHQIGRIDEPLRTLASWSPAQVQQVDQDVGLIRAVLDTAAKGLLTPQRTNGRTLVLKDLPSLLDLEVDDLFEPGRPIDPAAVANPKGRARDAIAKIMVQVAMLHTDLMMVARDEAAGIQLPTMPSTTLRVLDAQPNNVSSPEIYWHAAREAIDLVEPTPRGQAFAREWYHVTSELLLAQRDYAVGRGHLEHARDVLPADATLALDLGAAYENLAAPGIQAALADSEAAMASGSRPTLLAKAEFQFRSALLLDPEIHDAGLRLGHTLQLLGRQEEALHHLSRIEPLLGRPEHRYCAALFSGQAHEIRGRDDEARAAFERALKQSPGAQSARLALAELTMKASGQAEAIAYVRTTASGVPTADPWWRYDISFTSDVSAHLASLLASAMGVVR